MAATINDYRLTVGALLSCRPWQLYRQTTTARAAIANQHVVYPGLTRGQTVTAAQYQLDDALFALSLCTRPHGAGVRQWR